MDVNIEETPLWKSAFATEHCKTVAQAKARETLIVHLRALEAHVAALLTKIPEDCKGLTQHDISHVHQLWSVASVLCGEKYPINPVEGFVLGAAFLIHDAGLTAAAYPGGLKGVKASALYRDLVANGLKRADPDLRVSSEDLDNAPQEIRERALFDFLRLVHAERASKLLDQSYVHPLLGVAFTLIPADMLLDLGEIIGKIAASHHWDIKRVDAAFPSVSPPLASYPDWEIDALKLACILRAADACAIDERRAGTMPFIIENPRGISRSHWAFQKYLKPGYLPPRAEALRFESKRALPRAEMDAWWIAFDAIVLADRELRGCDRLLKQRAGRDDHDPRVPLRAMRVEGAGDAQLLANYVRVEGWQPVDTSARIDDPLAIIESLGGANLYGDDASAPLRELLQNAADAVRARRELGGYGPNPNGSPGEIKVVVEKPVGSAKTWKLTIIDDGIGMPASVLAGEFLDFGKSLWRSDRLATLYPGLGAKHNFRPTGRYGIGFYAAFTIASDVKVMTKPYRGGDTDRLVLHFLHGVRGRAELRSYREDLDTPWPFGASTIIELRLNDPSWFREFAMCADPGREYGGVTESDEKHWKYFLQALRMLVFPLDVVVVLTCPFIERVRTNRVDIFSINSQEFIAEWNDVFENQVTSSKIETELNSLIDTIGDPRESKSRGCIATASLLGRGVMHIGGFTVSGMRQSRVQGIVECVPLASNRRNVKLAEQLESFVDWGNRQLRNAEFRKLSPAQMSDALISLWDIGVDISDFFFLWDLNGKMIFFRELQFDKPPTFFLALSPSRGDRNFTIGQLLLPMQVGNQVEQSRDFTHVFGNNFGHSTRYNGTNVPVMPAGSDDRTAFDALLKYINDQGFDAQIEGPSHYVIGYYKGQDGGVGPLIDPNLKRGDSIKNFGLIIRCRPRTPKS